MNPINPVSVKGPVEFKPSTQKIDQNQTQGVGGVDGKIVDLSTNSETRSGLHKNLSRLATFLKSGFQKTVTPSPIPQPSISRISPTASSKVSGFPPAGEVALVTSKLGSGESKVVGFVLNGSVISKEKAAAMVDSNAPGTDKLKRLLDALKRGDETKLKVDNSGSKDKIGSKIYRENGIVSIQTGSIFSRSKEPIGVEMSMDMVQRILIQNLDTIPVNDSEGIQTRIVTELATMLSLVQADPAAIGNVAGLLQQRATHCFEETVSKNSDAASTLKFERTMQAIQSLAEALPAGTAKTVITERATILTETFKGRDAGLKMESSIRGQVADLPEDIASRPFSDIISFQTTLSETATQLDRLDDITIKAKGPMTDSRVSSLITLAKDVAKKALNQISEVATAVHTRLISTIPTMTAATVVATAQDIGTLRQQLTDCQLTPDRIDDVESQILTRAHLATHLNASDLSGISAEGSLYDKVTPEMKTGIVTMYQSGVFSKDDIFSGSFLQRMARIAVAGASDEESTSTVNLLSRHITQGNFSWATDVVDMSLPNPDGTWPPISARPPQFDDIIKHIGLYGEQQGTEPTGSIQIRSALFETARTLCQASPDLGIRDLKSLVFDERTVKALMTAIPSAETDLLFGHAMILQYKLNNNLPLNSPAPAALCQQLQNVGISTTTGRISQFVTQGYTSSKAVNEALLFVKKFSESLSKNPKIQAILVANADIHMDTLAKEFQGRMVISRLGGGTVGIDEAAQRLDSPDIAKKMGLTGTGTSKSFGEKIKAAFTDVRFGVGTDLGRLRTISEKISGALIHQASVQTAQSNVEALTERRDALQAEMFTHSSLSGTDPGIDVGVLSKAIRMAHNIQVSQNELALLNEPLSSPPPGGAVISPDHELLAAKSTFVIPPSTFMGMRGKEYPFKSQDAPGCFIRTNEQGNPSDTDTDQFLGLYSLQHTDEGTINRNFVGFLDPNDPSVSPLLEQFKDNVTKSIAHAQATRHQGENMRLVQPKVESHLGKLHLQQTIQQLNLEIGVENGTVATGTAAIIAATKIVDSLVGASEGLGPVTDAIRLSIAGVVIDAVNTGESLNACIENVKNGSLKSAILTRFQNFAPVPTDGSTPPDYSALVDRELLTFDGAPTIKAWISDIRYDKATQAQMAATAQLRGTDAYIDGHVGSTVELKKMVDFVEGISDGGSESILWGLGVSLSTSGLGEAAQDTLTFGAASAEVSVGGSHARELKLSRNDLDSGGVKTSRYSIDIDRQIAGSLGISLEFLQGIVTAGVGGTAGHEWGYQIEFDSKESAGRFLLGLKTGNMAEASLALPSAVHKASKIRIEGSMEVSAQLQFPLDKISDDLGELPFIGALSAGFEIKSQASRQWSRASSSNGIDRTIETVKSGHFSASMLGSLTEVTTDTSRKVSHRYGVLTSATIQDAAKIVVKVGASDVLPATILQKAATMVLPMSIDTLRTTNPAAALVVDTLLSLATPGDEISCERRLPPALQLQVIDASDPNSGRYNLETAKSILKNDSLYVLSAVSVKKEALVSDTVTINAKLVGITVTKIQEGVTSQTLRFEIPS